jgi:Flp pilus assembly pilin Flp
LLYVNFVLAFDDFAVTFLPSTIVDPHHSLSKQRSPKPPWKIGKETLQMLNFLKNLHKEESGQDLIEYALIGLIVALGAIAGMGTLASSINTEFQKIASQLS